MAGTVKHKAIKYRLYPTDSQAEFFRKNYGAIRKKEKKNHETI